MYNNEIYNALLLEFGEEEMIKVTDIISAFYAIKYNGSKTTDLLEEFDYERDWWLNKNSSSITPFVGIGSSYGKPYLKYFIEIQYNAAFNESWLNAGVTANMYGFKNRNKIFQ